MTESMKQEVRSKKTSLLAALSAAGLLFAGCGSRTILVDLVPTESRLKEQTIESADAGIFAADKIALITVSGLIANAHKGAILSAGQNPVSDFRETLDAIAKDPG